MMDPTLSMIVAAITTALPPTLVALGALLQGRRNAIAAERNALAAAVTDKKVDVAVAKTDTIIEKAAEIHTLTNSNLSKVTAALEVANEKILGLQKLMNEMMQAKQETKLAALTSQQDVARALERPPKSDPGTLGTASLP